MIILGEKTEGCNILHIIIGPETENQFNFSGQSVMDITEYLHNMDRTVPCKLVINRCDSEQDVIETLAMQETGRQARNMIQEIQKKLGKQFSPDEEIAEGFGIFGPPVKQNPKKKPTLNTEKKGSDITCPICHAKNAAIVKDGLVFPCKSCQLIEEGLKAKEIPPVPDDLTLEDLRQQIEDEHPSQRSSLSRYLEEERDRQEKEMYDEDGNEVDDDEDEI